MIAQRLLLLVVLGLSGASCGKKSPESIPAGPALDIPSAPDRARTGLQACNLATVEEVAALAGGIPLTQPPMRGSACMYVIDHPERGAESYLLSLQPAGLIKPVLDLKTGEEKGEAITGLGDEAWLRPRESSAGYTLLVLRGEQGLEVSGDRREPLSGIARLALSRIP
jgi:hypothetical protein